MRRALKEFDFYGKRRVFYALSAIVILAGLISLALPGFGLRPGLDFSGGSLLEAKFERTDVTTSEVRTALASLDLGEPIIQQSAEDPANRMGKIVLHKGEWDAVGRKLGHLVGFHKKAALISETQGPNEDDLWDF